MFAFGQNPNLLIVGNFSSETGYAWDTIQEYFVALGKMFLEQGHRAVVCFPEVRDLPARFKSEGIEVVRFDFSRSSVPALYRLIREHRIGVLYLTDWPTVSLRYVCSRLMGVRTIIVHKRTSGGQNTLGRLRTWVKRAVNRNRLFSADRVIAISEHVRKRLVVMSCFPEERADRIWNGVDTDKFKPGSDPYVFSEYRIPREKRIVFAYSRAVRYKGIEVLIDAADILVHRQQRKDLVFLYCGDGPDLAYFRAKVNQLKLDAHFICPGKTENIHRILKGVEIVVVPSLWDEPFGLAVIEAMATGKVVLASKVGGIVDIITDSIDGYLLPPGDSRSLAAKISEVVDRPDTKGMIGSKAREAVLRKFNIVTKKKELLALVAQTSGMAPSC